MVVKKNRRRRRDRCHSEISFARPQMFWMLGKAVKRMTDPSSLNKKVSGNFQFRNDYGSHSSIVQTGEEEEDTVFQVRGKLYALSEQNSWKERGTGLLKLNVRKSDGGGARLGSSPLILGCLATPDLFH